MTICNDPSGIADEAKAELALKKFERLEKARQALFYRTKVYNRFLGERRPADNFRQWVARSFFSATFEVAPGRFGQIKIRQ